MIGNHSLTHQVVITEDFPVAVDLVVLRLDMPHTGKADISSLHCITTTAKPVLQGLCPEEKMHRVYI